MFQLSENAIRDKTVDISYRKGLQYLRAGKVLSIKLKRYNDAHFGGETTGVIAAVAGSGHEEYEVEAYINSKEGFVDYSCTCAAFRGYFGGKTFCKHIVAVLLKYYDKNRNENIFKVESDIVKTSGVIKFNEIAKIGVRVSKIDNLIKTLNRTISLADFEKDELNIGIKFEMDNFNSTRVSSIELKIGEKKLYVVKSIKNFIEATKGNGLPLEFGKGFTFNINDVDFKKEDIEIINLLTEIYESEQRANQGLYGYNRNYSSGKFLSGKKAYLTDSQVKRFFNHIKDREIDVVIKGEPYNSVKVLSEDIPFEFDLRVKNNKVLLEIDSLPILINDDGTLVFYKENIYNVSEKQAKLLTPFLNEFISSKNNMLNFEKEDSEKIATNLIPYLRKITKKIEVDESFSKNFYQEPLVIEIYLDKDEDNISLEMLFKYGSVSLTPFSEGSKSQGDKMLIRDTYKEKSAMALLLNLGFQKQYSSFLLSDEEKIVDFIHGDMDRLQEIGEVYYSQEFKGIKIYGSSSFKSKMILNNMDLLEFSFEIEGVDKKELANIFNAIKEKKKYFKLKEGGFVSLEDKEILSVANLLDSLDIKGSDMKKDVFNISKYNALYIDQYLKQNEMFYVEKNKKFRDLAMSINNIKELDINVPEQLEEIMRGYQKFGFKWLKTLSAFGFGGILADEMGLGKTLQTIAFIASNIEEDKENYKPALVIAPSSLIYNWKDEIEKFAPNIRALVISGNKKDRNELRGELENHDVIITSYPLIRRDIDEYKSFEFSYCFIDEAQHIKNATSLNSQSVKEIKAKGFFALTGTPIENSLSELWSIFDFIMPGYFMSHRNFQRKYELPIIKNGDTKALQELNKKVKPFILRRLKKDVVKELPPKIEHKLVVEMTEEQKKLYLAFIETAKEELAEEFRDKGFNKSKLKILAVLTRLRQICCDPSVFIEDYKGESGKILALEELLEESFEQGHRVLLFSQFTSVLKNIGKMLHKNHTDYMYLDGSTKIIDRGTMVKEFNEGKSKIFLISLKAGGTGLNLTGADLVIHFDPWWNPAVEDQATDRAHRIGQEKTVEVIKLLAKGTIEEKIFNLQDKKREIIKSVMGEESSEETLISGITEEELQDLFKFEMDI